LRKQSAMWGWLIVGVAAAITAAAYSPGLHGGFVYDDFSFLVGNAAVQVTEGSLAEWVRAAMSFPAGTNQGRWLGMLSFAGNHFFTGMDPYGFKLTNLVIHLLNGLLLFLALRALFDFHHVSRPARIERTRFDTGLAAAALAALWLVLPINLTGVLYVSQRLESLSNTFVFLGLWWYLRVRLAHWRGEKGSVGMWLALIVSTGIGVLIKESAILLPLYTFCVEFALTGGRNREGRWSRPVIALYGGLLLVPLIGGLIWLAAWVDGSRSYGRAFDIPQRLMTEGRVLIEYMVWTLTPSLDALTLYHDDIMVSRNLVDPPTTLLSLLAIAGLIGISFWQRARRPLLALGILWYFGGHLLTATVIPLMLAFEHRNYFPSVGLLLAVAALLVLEGPRVRIRTIAFVTTAVFCFYAFTTALRALEWSDPTRLSLSEASKRPRSSNAQFARATVMLGNMRRPDGMPMVEDAFVVLEDGSRLPGAGAYFEQELITQSAQRGRPIESKWWESFIRKLGVQPPSVSDARALSLLNHCFMDKRCGSDITPLKRAYDAALSHGNTPATIWNVHAEFAWHLLGDRAEAERDMRAAVARSPFDINAQSNLAILLLAMEKLDEADRELDRLRARNWFGMLDATIRQLEAMLQQKRAAQRGKEGATP
jgi:protein O-mannosyl-transferase